MHQSRLGLTLLALLSGCADAHVEPEEGLEDCQGAPVWIGAVTPENESIELVATAEGFVVGFRSEEGFRMLRLSMDSAVTAESVLPIAPGRTPPQLVALPEGLTVVAGDEGRVVGWLLGEDLAASRRVELTERVDPRSAFRAVAYPEAGRAELAVAVAAGSQITPSGTSTRFNPVHGLSWNGRRFSIATPLGHGVWQLFDPESVFGDESFAYQWSGVAPRFDAGLHFAPDAHLRGRHAAVVSQRGEVHVVIEGREPLVVPLAEDEPGYSSIDADADGYIVATSGSFPRGESGLLSFRVDDEGALEGPARELVAGDPADFGQVVLRASRRDALGAAWTNERGTYFACFRGR